MYTARNLLAVCVTVSFCGKLLVVLISYSLETAMPSTQIAINPYGFLKTMMQQWDGLQGI
jgi:hypothetical protein